MQLRKAGKRVVIFKLQARLSQSFNPEREIKRLPIPGFGGDESVIARRVREASGAGKRKIGRALVRVTGAELIAPMDYLCDRETCPAVDRDGSPIYVDNGHIRASQAVKLATFVDDVLKPSDGIPHRP